MKTGLNLNCIDGNARIPAGYVLHPSTPLGFVLDLLDDIQTHMAPSRVRTIMWMAERDNTETPWLHIPIDNAELVRIQQFAWECHTINLQLEIAIAPIWESAWWLSDPFYTQTGPIPDNPFATVDELYSALQSSLWRLLFTGNKLPPGTIIDINNEFDLSGTQQPLMKLWYPWLRDAIHQAGLISALSTIIELDGTGFRALKAYNWVANLGHGMPTKIELHINSVSDTALTKEASYWANELRKRYPLCDIIIGEDDVLRNIPGKCAEWVAKVNPTEYIKWID